MTALELFRARYDEEWTKQAALQQNTSTAIGLMTLLGTGLAFLGQQGIAQTIPYAISFWSMLAIATAAWVVAGGILIRSMVRMRYRTVAPADEWRTYHKQLVAASNEASIGPQAAAAEFEEFGCDAYSDAAAVNWNVNARRGRLIFWANAGFVVAVTFAVVTAVPLGLALRARTPEVHQVRITNFPESADARRTDSKRGANSEGSRSTAKDAAVRPVQGDSATEKSRLHTGHDRK